MAASASSVSGRGRLESLQGLLECPVEFRLMYDAVSLVPCGHTISQVAREKLQECPICRKMIQNSTPNWLVRQIVVFHRMPAHCKQVESDYKGQDPLPYPGKSAKFICSKHWKVKRDSGSYSERIFEFHSIIKDSLIQRFSVLGRKDNTVTLIWDHIVPGYDRFYKQWKEYLYSCELPGISPVLNTLDSIDNIDSFQNFFKLVAENNEFPEEDWPLLQLIIANANNWKDVAGDNSVLEHFGDSSV